MTNEAPLINPPLGVAKKKGVRGASGEVVAYFYYLTLGTN